MADGVLIQLSQGVLNPPAGEALIGVAGTSVTAQSSNVSPAIKGYTWTMIDVPPTSAIPRGVLAIGNTPNIAFDPDVAGGYHLELETIDVSKQRSRIRTVFLVPTSTGRKVPPFGATSAELNFAGSTRGWSPIMEEWLAEIDALSAGLSGSVLSGTSINAAAVNLDFPALANSMSFTTRITILGSRTDAQGCGHAVIEELMHTHAGSLVLDDATDGESVNLVPGGFGATGWTATLSAQAGRVPRVSVAGFGTSNVVFKVLFEQVLFLGGV